MSMTMAENIKRWTATRKAALAIEINQGETPVYEASRTYDLVPSEIEAWREGAKKGMENLLRANPLDSHAQYEKQLKDLQETYGDAMLELRAQKNVSGPNGAGGRQLIRTLHEGQLANGINVPIAKLCDWFSVPSRTVYCKPTKSAPKIHPRFADPIKTLIQEANGHCRAFRIS